MIFWIAKHETKGEGGGDYYNQFRENQDGIPNHHDDGDGPGGFGVFQVTGTAANKDEKFSEDKSGIGKKM